MVTADQSGYRNLRVWQRAMDCAEMIHTVTRGFPKDELYGLTSQIRRAANSVPLNIAEGYKRRRYKRKYLQALIYASGSEGEVETAIELAQRFKYIAPNQAGEMAAQYDEVGRMLSALIARIEADIEKEEREGGGKRE